MTKPGNTSKNTIDLSSLDTAAACDQGAEIELRHPVTNVGLGQFIKIVGKDSAIFRANIARIGNAARRAEEAAKRRGRTADVTTVEKNDEQNIELLVNSTVDFRDVNFDGRSDFPFSPDNARRLYTSLIFVRDQINEAVGDLENFMPA